MNQCHKTVDKDNELCFPNMTAITNVILNTKELPNLLDTHCPRQSDFDTTLLMP